MIRVSAEDAEKFYGVTDSSKTERYYLLDNGNIIDSCGNIRYIPSGYTCLIGISRVEDGAVREVVAYGSVSGTVMEAA